MNLNTDYICDLFSPEQLLDFLRDLVAVADIADLDPLAPASEVVVVDDVAAPCAKSSVSDSVL